MGIVCACRCSARYGMIIPIVSPRIPDLRASVLMARYRLWLVLLVFVGLIGLVACDASQAGVPLPTRQTTADPNVIYVTATPPEYGENPTATPWVIYVTATPTVTPHVIYVTATPPGGLTSTPTPFVIFVTATPQPVGPYYGTPAGPAAPTLQPTLDLSGVTLIAPPTAAPPATATPEFPLATLPPPTTTPPLPLPTVTPLPPTAPLPPPTVAPRPGALYSDRLGINFISSAQHQADEQRFAAGLDAGAGWDRFAIYWNEIEQQPDQYIWTLYDDTVRNDVLHGLKTNAILIGTPDLYASSTWTPSRTFEPVFSDGSDTPGAGKTINPSNPWAEFVYNVVQRYRPGGVLAQREGWPSGAGVRVWEIWNEPDFTQFWRGGVEEYARLLKVAYIAARHADPQAQIMIGGLVLFEQPEFLPSLLAIYKNDPAPVDKRYPFDIVAVHSYSNPPFTFYAVQRTETLLAVHNLGDTPIWVNESGVTVWNDYPGPTWATRRDQIVWRASLDEQASYIMSNATFAFLAGADKLFHFQLYDDCGNQPRGTTFPPHDGSLCQSQSVCWGDALGLLRNRADNVCFNQHPQPGTARPAYTAFHTVSQIFGSGDLVPLTGYTAAGRQWTILARPSTREIVTVIWDESGQPGEAVVAARSTQATLIQLTGQQQTIQPSPDGSYHIPLSPATNRNQPGLNGFMIGGPPVVLIEPSPQPVVSVLPLLDYSRSAALVKWQSSDPSIVAYEVYYRDDTSGANEWVLWIQTDRPDEALFVAGIGRRYSFFARGRTADGVWTADAPYSQAWTVLE